MPRIDNKKITNLSTLLEEKYRQCYHHSALHTGYFVNYEIRILDLFARMFSTKGPSAACFFYNETLSLNQLCIFFNSHNVKIYGDFDLQQSNLQQIFSLSLDLQQKISLDTIVSSIKNNEELFNSVMKNSKIYSSMVAITQDLSGRIKHISKLLCQSQSYKNEYVELYNSLMKMSKNLKTVKNNVLYFDNVVKILPEFCEIIGSLKNVYSTFKTFNKELCDEIIAFNNILGEFLRPFIDMIKLIVYSGKNSVNKIEVHREEKADISDDEMLHAELKGISTMCIHEELSDNLLNGNMYFGSSLLCCAECFIASSLFEKIGFRGTHSCYFNEAGEPSFLSPQKIVKYREIKEKLEFTPNTCSTADGYLSDDEEYTPSELTAFIRQKADFTSFLRTKFETPVTQDEFKTSEFIINNNIDVFSLIELDVIGVNSGLSGS